MGQAASGARWTEVVRHPANRPRANTEGNNVDNREVYMSMEQLKTMLSEVGVALPLKQEILRVARESGTASPPKRRWLRRSSFNSSSSAGTAPPLRIISRRSSYRSDDRRTSPSNRRDDSERARSDITPVDLNSDTDHEHDIIFFSDNEHENVSVYSGRSSSAYHLQPQRTLEPVIPGHWKLGHKIGTGKPSHFSSALNIVGLTRNCIEGSFGEVYTGINTLNGQLIAVKCLPLSKPIFTAQYTKYSWIC